MTTKFRKRRIPLVEKRGITQENENSILIDCYRVRVEFRPEGFLRLYFFNVAEKGDVCLEIPEEVSEIKIFQEKGRNFVFGNPFINPSKRSI
jgi:hypothetical protein